MIPYYYLTLPHLIEKYSNNTIDLSQLDLAYVIFEVIIGFLTLLITSFTLIVFYCERHRFNEVRHYYAVSLTFSDFLFVLIGVPLYIGASLGWPLNETGCLVELAFLISAGLVTVLSMVMASIDKCWAVLCPFSYLNNATHNKAKLFIAITWLLGIIIGSLPVFGWNKIAIEKVKFQKCFYMSIIPKSYMIFVLAAVIVPCSIIMIFIYSSIYYVHKKALLTPSTSISPAKKMTIRKPPNETSSLLGNDSKNPPKKYNMGPLLFTTVFSFMICWLPLYIIDVLYATIPNFQLNQSLKAFLATLRHINGLIVPYLYAYQMVDFKIALRKRTGKKWTRMKIASRFIGIKKKKSNTTS
uniref:CSON006762 protein n=1 Tax=Culicoides sonorensis TaxID=179676 RepID=A0A336MU64_CULSO